MAGNPLAKLLPIIKKNAVMLWILLGPLLFFKNRYSLSTTYKEIYSEAYFQRAYHITKLEEYLQDIEDENLKKKSAKVKESVKH